MQLWVDGCVHAMVPLSAGLRRVQDLVFYGVLGIKDPLRPDVKQAVVDCHRAGINVRMVTGDNVVTARAIAVECGIVKSDDDLVIEGPAFRKMTPKEVDAILPRLKVMARSSPRDKNMLVRRLNGSLPKTPEEWEKVRWCRVFPVAVVACLSCTSVPA